MKRLHSEKIKKLSISNDVRVIVISDIPGYDLVKRGGIEGWIEKGILVEIETMK
ncbi:hypothetical protein [Bacillus sp. FSL R5-0677]|uniref:hypothetical protein n=1 Tax=Bacillus sp. FSL R5-0677 TaxID=2921581 RepID=UPI0030F4F224